MSTFPITNAKEIGLASISIPMPTTTTASVRIVYPGDALMYLTNCKYHRQRNINPDRVSTYAREMVAGHFVQGTDLYMGVLQGKEYLLNGQHRLNAVIQSKMPTEFTIITKVVSSERELDDIYSNLDQQGNRTIIDTIRAHGSLFEGKYDAQILRSIAAASSLVLRGLVGAPIKGRKPTQLEQIRRIHYWQPTMDIYLAAINKGNFAGRLRSSGYMAMGLLTCKYWQDEATSFWEKVSSGENLSSRHPAFVLRNFIINTRIGANSISADMRKDRNQGLVTTHHAIRYATACWAHYVNNREVGYVKVAGLEENFRIEGIDLKQAIKDMEAYNV